jgi:UDP-glucose 4-epimerase
MTQRNTLLVTGVGGFWGARVAERLVKEADVRVIGIGSRPPEDSIRHLDFVQADVRNPLLVELLRDEGVTGVCHMAFVESYRPSEAAFDANVMGAMRLFGACVAAGVTRIVVPSSTLAYGARPGNSAFLTERLPLNGSASWGSIRDLMEIEAFCNGFRAGHPEVALTVLRFAHPIGPSVDSPLVRFLANPAAPVLFGFDPLMQMVHESDVVEAVVQAVLVGPPGTYNIASDGILPLAKVCALAGKVALPVFHLAAYWSNPLLATMRLPIEQLWPLPPDYLRYPVVADLERQRSVFGFEPQYIAEEALREFAGRSRLARLAAGASELFRDEQRLRDTLERRRRQRERSGRTEWEADEAEDALEELA